MWIKCSVDARTTDGRYASSPDATLTVRDGNEWRPPAGDDYSYYNFKINISQQESYFFSTILRIAWKRMIHTDCRNSQNAQFINMHEKERLMIEAKKQIMEEMKAQLKAELQAEINRFHMKRPLLPDFVCQNQLPDFG